MSQEEAYTKEEKKKSKIAEKFVSFPCGWYKCWPIKLLLLLLRFLSLNNNVLIKEHKLTISCLKIQPGSTSPAKYYPSDGGGGRGY